MQESGSFSMIDGGFMWFPGILAVNQWVEHGTTDAKNLDVASMQ